MSSMQEFHESLREAYAALRDTSERLTIIRAIDAFLDSIEQCEAHIVDANDEHSLRLQMLTLRYAVFKQLINSVDKINEIIATDQY